MLSLNRFIISEDDQNECVGVYSDYTLLGIEDSLRSQLIRIQKNQSELPMFHAMIAYFGIDFNPDQFKISFTDHYDSESAREKDQVNIIFLRV